jgi:hypothetical protein
MAMAQATLKTELVNMALFDTEAAAIAAWAEAWTTYYEDAQAGAVAVTVAALRTTTPPATSNPRDELISGLAGLSTGGASAIQAGLQAFWNIMNEAPAAAAVYFAGATAVTSPGFAGLPATLQATFDNNRDTQASKSDSYDDIATDLHASNLGGTATIGGAPVAIT